MDMAPFPSPIATAQQELWTYGAIQRWIYKEAGNGLTYGDSGISGSTKMYLGWERATGYRFLVESLQIVVYREVGFQLLSSRCMALQ
jgi:hypothetical protein